MDASLGFEPRLREPKTLVLPLHYEAKVGWIDIWTGQSYMPRARATRNFTHPKGFQRYIIF